MSKIIVCSMALLFLTGSAAFGGILQGQNWGVGVNNDIFLQESQQNGQSAQNVLINLSQQTEGAGVVFAQANLTSSSHQFGGGLLGGGLLGSGLLGTSSLSTHASALGIGGLHRTPLMINPLGSSMLLHGVHMLP
jgi:hypothetical protein